MGGGKEGFLSGRMRALSERILGPSPETMALAEQEFLMLVQPGVEKAGVQPGQIHKFIISGNPLYPTIGFKTINILMGLDGALTIDSITAVKSRWPDDCIGKVITLRGKKRLAVLVGITRELTKLQS